MSLYNIGNFIRRKREELGITQEELSEGICSVTTLSRLENGEQTPRSNNVRALLQRLGYSDAMLFQAAGQEEFEIVQLQVGIRQLYNYKNFSEAKELFSKLGEYQKFFSVTDWQFYEAMYTNFYEDEFTNEEMIDKLVNALRLTHPRFSIDNLPKILTFEESTVLNKLANIYELIGKRKNAIKILYHMKEFYEREIVDKQEALRVLPTVLYNLSKLLGLSGRYDECIEVCNQGIRLMKESGRTRRLPQTLYNLSWALAKRGRECDIEPAKKAVKEAYCLSSILEDRPDFLELLTDFVKKNFRDEFPLLF